MNHGPQSPGEEGWGKHSLLSDPSAIGQIALALVRMLHQPLDTILRHLEAADRLLDSMPLDRNALRRVLTSIRTEHRGAALCLHRLRDLADKHALDARALAIDQMLQEILQLLRPGVAATSRDFSLGAEQLKQRLREVFERAFAADNSGLLDQARQQELRERFSALTSRERQVLARVIRGRLNKQIAADLCLSERTVKHHRTHLTRKLRVGSAVELLRLSQEAHIEASLADVYLDAST